MEWVALAGVILPLCVIHFLYNSYNSERMIKISVGPTHLGYGSYRKIKTGMTF